MEPTTTMPEAPTAPAAPAPVMPKPASKMSSHQLLLGGLLLLVLAGLGVGVFGLLQAGKAQKTADSATARVAKLESATDYVKGQLDANAYQAVFLNGGQVYFGKITNINYSTMTLEHIYYLSNGSFDKTTQQTSGTNVSLVKLGNELHKPQDKMIIERKNVTFWENLKSDGEVTKAITNYEKQNPSSK